MSLIGVVLAVLIGGVVLTVVVGVIASLSRNQATVVARSNTSVRPWYHSTTEYQLPQVRISADFVDTRIFPNGNTHTRSIHIEADGSALYAERGFADGVYQAQESGFLGDAAWRTPIEGRGSATSSQPRYGSRFMPPPPPPRVIGPPPRRHVPSPGGQINRRPRIAPAALDEVGGVRHPIDLQRATTRHPGRSGYATVDGMPHEPRGGSGPRVGARSTPPSYPHLSTADVDGQCSVNGRHVSASGQLTRHNAIRPAATS